MSDGFDVEIDVWLIGGVYYLGHDSPQYEVAEVFFDSDRLWCHAKNAEVLVKLLEFGIEYPIGLTKEEYLKIVETDKDFKQWRLANGQFKDSKDKLYNRKEAQKAFGIAHSEEILPENLSVPKSVDEFNQNLIQNKVTKSN